VTGGPAGGILNHAYFPDGAVLSLATVLFAAMYSRTSFNRSLVQLEGGLVRVPINVVVYSDYHYPVAYATNHTKYNSSLLTNV
jgi:hypothetical protein